VLRAADAPVLEAVDYLRRLADALNRWLPAVSVHYDLAELRGYRYKTGVVFAAFVPGWGLEIARGGRYDDIGRVFGRARPAVGFSTDLKGLLRLGQGLAARYRESAAVYAPWSPDPALLLEIERLRQVGERVITALPGGEAQLDRDPRPLGCDRRLVEGAAGWELQDL
jgi:ATP phosphoribosyltransferase regulatory subunit